jgi:hypothetical protein
MNRNWFWATLAFLTVFTSAVVSWALIYAPVRFNPETISCFETQLNGVTQKHDVWICDEDLNRLLPSMVKKLQDEGWTAVGNGMDFAPALLGLSTGNDDFSHNLQIKIFKKNENTKTIGLWEPPGAEKTYGWTCDTLVPAGNRDFVRSHWNFPFQPPANADSFYLEEIKNLKIAIISMPRNETPSEQFQKICVSQGFQLTPFETGQPGSVFILTQAHHRLLAEIESNENQNLYSLVSLN